MNPRDYDMSKRAAAVQQTRRRIVEATVELHGEKGIFGTSWQDIARRADVSVATVYQHFPTLDELVPACGEVLMERLRPPSPESAPTIVGDAGDVAARLERVASELFDFYERGGPHLDVDLRERELPAMQEWETYLRSTVATFVAEAVKGCEVEPDSIELASAFFDYSTLKALQSRGVSAAVAARAVSAMVACWIDKQRPEDRTSTSTGRRRHVKPS